METLTQTLSQEALLGTRIGEVYRAESYEIEAQFETADRHDEWTPIESGLSPLSSRVLCL